MSPRLLQALVVAVASSLGVFDLRARVVGVSVSPEMRDRGVADIYSSATSSFRLDHSRTVHVVSPLRLANGVPSVVVLPPDEEFQLSVEGGSGTYRFRSLNSTVCQMTGDGLMHSGVGVSGKTSVVIWDARNPLNSISIDVVVWPVGGLVVEAEKMQISVGDSSKVGL